MISMTHNEAMLYLLMNHANEEVPMPQIMAFTSEYCNSFCSAVHSRASDLRKKYGYDIHNSVSEGIGKKVSTYKLEISRSHLKALKEVFVPGQKVPHFSQLQARVVLSKPVQQNLFEVFI